MVVNPGDQSRIPALPILCALPPAAPMPATPPPGLVREEQPTAGSLTHLGSRGSPLPPPADEPGTAKPDGPSNSVCLLWQATSADTLPLPVRWGKSDEEKIEAATNGKATAMSASKKKKKRKRSKAAELASVSGG